MLGSSSCLVKDWQTLVSFDYLYSFPSYFLVVMYILLSCICWDSVYICMVVPEFSFLFHSCEILVVTHYIILHSHAFVRFSIEFGCNCLIPFSSRVGVPLQQLYEPMANE